MGDSSLIEEASFRLLFDGSPDGILIADVETRLNHYANRAAVEMFGYTAAELCAMNVAALHPPGAVAEAMADFGALARGERTVSVDVPFRTKLGADLRVDIRVTLGTIAGRPMIVGFFRDVTERWRARHALAVSESRYRGLFESATDGILIVDADRGTVLDANPFVTALTGYSADELLGQQLSKLGLFDHLAGSKVSLAELRTHAYVRHDDLPLRARDGRALYVEFVSSVYLVGDKQVIHCNLRDVAARRRANAERELLARAIEQAGEMVLVTDANGDIRYVNPAFEIGTGYSLAQVLGRNPRLLNSGVQDAAFYRGMWESVLAGKIWQGRLVNRKKDGSRYTQEGTVSAVRDKDGGITNYVAVARDITKTLKLESQYLHAQKMEAVGRLAGGIAHDFNNVLSVILSYGEIVSGDLPPDSPLRSDVDEITRAGVRASVLTRQLLAFSRQQVLEPRVLRLDRVVSEMERMLRRLLGADIELTMLLPSEPWNVKADVGQIEQVLMNLAVNARDAMPHGGALTIESENVELDEEQARAHLGLRAGAYVQLAVSDTGIGMDKETQERIFEPFFTTKALGKGTGLGLATVFGIVAQSGGCISVYSEPGQGTTFKLYFPRVHDAIEAPSAEQVAAPPRRASGTILLVEDDDQVRALAAEVLRRQGYVVLLAANGGEAILASEQHAANIDLLLTDVVMPRLSGRQLAERLAPLRPAMKVLFMSGYTDDVVLQHGILNSGVEFLQKPVTPGVLIRKVGEVLRNGSARSRRGRDDVGEPGGLDD